MAGRGTAVLLLLGGCFHPNAAAGDPCSPSGACPSDQSCVAGSCVVSGGDVAGDAPFEVTATGDVPMQPDAMTDAALPACDPLAAWGTPQLIASLDGSASNDGTLRLLAGELSGYYWSDRPGGAGGDDIYFVTRPDHASDFTLSTVTGIDTASAELDPTTNRAGTVMVFRSNRAGGDKLFTASYSGTAWGSVVELAIDSTSTDEEPFISSDGQELVFASARAGGSGGTDLYLSGLGSGSGSGSDAWAAPVRLGATSTNCGEGDPAMSYNLKTLYFRSNREAGSSACGDYDIYMSTRTSTDEPFSPATIVPNINTTADDGPSWVSDDDCRLYISSAIAGTNDVYMSTRGMP